MSMVGADVPALLALVSQMTARAIKVDQTRNRVTALINDLQWVGPDRDAFVAEWNQQHSGWLTNLAGDLRDAAARVQAAANAQENASRG
jgi:uncharacterized protein YukE